MASMKTNMAGLMRWHRNNPRKRLDGYFTVDGKSLTHNQVLAALEYAIEHNWDLCDEDDKINAFVAWLDETYGVGIHGDPCNWKEYNLPKLDIYED